MFLIISSFVITVPLPLSIIKLLIVNLECGKEKYFPLTNQARLQTLIVHNVHLQKPEILHEMKRLKWN